MTCNCLLAKLLQEPRFANIAGCLLNQQVAQAALDLIWAILVLRIAATAANDHESNL